MTFICFCNAIPLKANRISGTITTKRRTATLTALADQPLLIRAARGQHVPRPPVWLMRQAGRYMAAFRKYSDHQPFRQRSESPSIAVELSLQPYLAFGTDAVIMFSDILTPLPALGVDFDVISGSGPAFPNPIRSPHQVDSLTNASFDPHNSLPFISEILSTLKDRLSTDPQVALLGFVGAPFTLAAYMIEGRPVKNLSYVKSFMYGENSGVDRKALHAILDRLSTVVAEYAIYQIDCGAQAIQLFDSWAHHLSPDQYAEFALPYAVKVAKAVKASRPEAVLIFFANGSGGKLHDISAKIASLVEVIGLDWSVRMSDARQVFGDNVVLQGNVDPCILSCGSEEQIRSAVQDTVKQAGERLIINLGHGVLKETPEAAVAMFVDEVKRTALSPVS